MIVLERTDIVDICTCISVIITMYTDYSIWKNSIFTPKIETKTQVEISINGKPKDRIRKE